MFEIVRIMNSSNSAAEPEKYPIADGTKIARGCALVMENGKLSACGNAVTPEYIAASDKISESGDATVYRISNNAELCVRIKCDSPSEYTCADRVSVLCEDGLSTVVSPDAQGTGIITGITGKPQFIYIRFTK